MDVLLSFIVYLAVKYVNSEGLGLGLGFLSLIVLPTFAKLEVVAVDSEEFCV